MKKYKVIIQGPNTIKNSEGGYEREILFIEFKEISDITLFMDDIMVSGFYEFTNRDGGRSFLLLKEICAIHFYEKKEDVGHESESKIS